MRYEGHFSPAHFPSIYPNANGKSASRVSVYWHTLIHFIWQVIFERPKFSNGELIILYLQQLEYLETCHIIATAQLITEEGVERQAAKHFRVILTIL